VIHVVYGRNEFYPEQPPNIVHVYGEQRQEDEPVQHGNEQLQLERLARKAGRGIWAYHPKRLRAECLQLMEYGNERAAHGAVEVQP